MTTDHAQDIRDLRDRMDRQHEALRNELTEYQLANERRFGELREAMAGMSRLMMATSGTIITVLTALQILDIL